MLIVAWVVWLHAFVALPTLNVVSGSQALRLNGAHESSLLNLVANMRTDFALMNGECEEGEKRKHCSENLKSNFGLLETIEIESNYCVGREITCKIDIVEKVIFFHPFFTTKLNPNFISKRHFRYSNCRSNASELLRFKLKINHF